MKTMFAPITALLLVCILGLTEGRPLGRRPLGIVYTKSLEYTYNETNLLNGYPFIEARIANKSDPYELVNGIKLGLKPNGTIADSALVKYQVKFPTNFRPSPGGFLPGIQAGEGSCSQANVENCFAIQLGWGKAGDLRVFALVPDGAFPSLSPAPTIVAKRLLLPLLSNLTLENNAYHKFQFLVGLNTPGVADGTLKLTVNGTTYLDVEDVMFRKYDNVTISTFLMHTYFNRRIPAGIQTIRIKNFVLNAAQGVNAPPPGPTDGDSDLTPAQKKRVISMTSIFENSQTDLKYDYCENIKDGRGYTFGYVGFTTATGDGYQLVSNYTALNPDNQLAPYLPTLQTLAKKGSSSTSNLAGFCEAVAYATMNDPIFNSTQDYMVQILYYGPAMKWANDYGMKLAISKGQIYDAAVQHGFGLEDWFSADYIFENVNKTMGGTPLSGVDEVEWLKEFMNERKKFIEQDSGASGATKRVLLYEELLDTGNLQMGGPIYIDSTKQVDGWTVTNIYYGEFVIYSPVPGVRRYTIK